MSKHNRWSKVKHKKGPADAKRGKMFTKLSKLITVAIQQGGVDLETNSSLRSAIEKAKEWSLPSDVIERAIKKGSGEAKEGTRLEHMTYEGFGPGGVAIYVHALTDNRNRTSANVREAFTKHGGNLGGPGVVAWMFQKKGFITAKPSETRREGLELELISAGVEDLNWEGELLKVLTSPLVFEPVLNILKPFFVQKSEISYVALEEKKITSKAQEEEILSLLDVLEEDNDVDEVFHNAQFPS